nr:heat shock cognate 70 kDa protein-like [Tanacetum cinerariifolium]
MSKKDVNDVVVVGGSTRIPKLQQMLTEFFDGKPLCKSINADEAVAYGAAALASNLCGNGNEKVKDLILLDVTPLSLGIRLCYETMGVMIPRNTPIPTMKERVYGTQFDNQVSAEFNVYQGESNSIRDNILLGSFALYDILAAPAGKQKFKVCFNIDASGIVNVSAKVISTGNKKSITIKDKKCMIIEEKKNNNARTEDKADTWLDNLIGKILKWIPN